MGGGGKPPLVSLLLGRFLFLHDVFEVLSCSLDRALVALSVDGGRLV